ncbi:hypothetical protein FRB95_012342 [Tulasnella sp. JGI-2019a]|nr:hypothetical protein FRB93_013960 [Tulasnella sp. JGI-2019a]KAG9034926.1 hypothetical protein FRB95_012342 [Tulasnella sp. JGI-2019a]
MSSLVSSSFHSPDNSSDLLLPPDYSHASMGLDAPSSPSVTSPPYSTVSSPRYSPQIPPNETFLDGSPAVETSSPPRLQLHVFKTRSPSMFLTISARQSIGTTAPAFGRGGMIDAALQVNGVIKSGDSLQLIIRGIATSVGNSSFSSKRVLFHTQDLHQSPGPGQASTSKASTTYPISFQLPTTVGDSDIPLPPSYYFRRPHVEAAVRYSLRIVWKKKGLMRTNEEIETVFLHLPRSRPSSPLPPSWWSPSSMTPNAGSKLSPYAYMPRQSLKEWNTISLTSLHNEADVQLQLSIPSQLSYQAHSKIPVKIMVFTPTLTVAESILDDVHVDLVKITTVATKNKADVYEEVLGTASFCKRDSWMPPCIEAENGAVVRTAHACVQGGRPQGELAWNIQGLIQVSYAIRVGTKPIAGSKSNWQHSQPIELTTDNEPEADENWNQAPALGLVGRS